MTKIDPTTIWKDVEAIRTTAPLVHNITNYVVMNTTANALLAIGASPVMAHAVEEVEEMAGIAGALVINIGTLSPGWIKSMFLAMGKAKERGIPIVFDPVGVGATDYRTRTARDLIGVTAPTIIRGNGSEIMALGQADAKTKGVDSTASSDSAMDTARDLNRSTGSVICVSGETDHIISATETASVANGHPMMPRVTGLGCTATALCGAFAAVNPVPVAAATHAMAVMGMAGEMAVENAAGPGSFQVAFIDALYCMTAADIEKRFKTAF
ncbi:MAG: hydroxyethylthiazole kinase [Desulfobacterales bacterium]|nr:hydroxyethylthiazole kinase [Desulfobacterales bacterium]